MAISVRITNGEKNAYLLLSIKAVFLFLGESEITQYSDIFTSSGTLNPLRQCPRLAFLVKLIPRAMSV